MYEMHVGLTLLAMLLHHVVLALEYNNSNAVQFSCTMVWISVRGIDFATGAKLIEMPTDHVEILAYFYFDSRSQPGAPRGATCIGKNAAQVLLVPPTSAKGMSMTLRSSVIDASPRHAHFGLAQASKKPPKQHKSKEIPPSQSRHAAAQSTPRGLKSHTTYM